MNQGGRVNKLKTALDVMDRIKDIDKYINSLRKGHKAISNWNEEFGEGNPHAANLKGLISELDNEKDNLEEYLQSVEVDKNLYNSTYVIEQRPVFVNKS